MKLEDSIQKKEDLLADSATHWATLDEESVLESEN